jgi:hypothetical protein
MGVIDLNKAAKEPTELDNEDYKKVAIIKSRDS